MTGFVRVKSAKRRDPQHKFDVSVEAVERHPERYKVVDPVPVNAPRPTEYTRGVEEPVSTIVAVDLPMHTADPVVEDPQ